MYRNRKPSSFESLVAQNLPGYCQATISGFVVLMMVHYLQLVVSWHSMSPLLNHPFAIWLLVVNPVTYVIYGLDKLAAKRHWWRVPEIVLLALGLVWGWPGAIIGQQCFRHKTQKQPFKTWFFVTVVINLVITVALLCVYGGSLFAGSVTIVPPSNVTIIPQNVPN